MSKGVDPLCSGNAHKDLDFKVVSNLHNAPSHPVGNASFMSFIQPSNILFVFRIAKLIFLNIPVHIEILSYMSCS